MKKTTRKLLLRKETLRELSAKALTHVIGGQETVTADAYPFSRPKQCTIADAYTQTRPKQCTFADAYPYSRPKQCTALDG